MVNFGDLGVRIQLALDVGDEIEELGICLLVQDRSAGAGKEVLTELRELPVVATPFGESGRIDGAETSRFEGAQDDLRRGPSSALDVEEGWKLLEEVAADVIRRSWHGHVFQQPILDNEHS